MYSEKDDVISVSLGNSFNTLLQFYQDGSISFKDEISLLNGRIKMDISRAWRIFEWVIIILFLVDLLLIPNGLEEAKSVIIWSLIILSVFILNSIKLIANTIKYEAFKQTVIGWAKE